MNDSKQKSGNKMNANGKSVTSSRKIAMIAGLLYLLTFISVPTLSLYRSIHDPNYIINPGPDTEVFIGVILEIIVALAGIGTAVVLFPILRKQSEVISLGLICSRVLEAGTIFAGAAFLFISGDLEAIWGG